MYQSTIQLCVMPLMCLCWARILPVPGNDDIVNAEPGLVASDDPRKLPALSSSRIMTVKESVMAQSDILVNPSQDVMVVVTATIIETTVVVSVTPELETPSSRITTAAALRAPADNQPQTMTITYTPEAGTATGASDTDAISTASINKSSLLVDTKTPPHHLSSTLRSTHTSNVTTTFVTITSVISSSSLTSSFDDATCDDIFCNTDGNRICIYWAGVTSWDISRGPMPGERPTIIGAC
ncbi:hypothetical protein F5Y03DRAFT_406026 [Xylaria venustula]|nr:hypothetical protein F5Y03DRAFT_406026 [Xylaria venustula]